MDLLPSDESVESAKAAAAKEGEGQFFSLGEVLEGRSKTKDGGGKGAGGKIGGGGGGGWGSDGLTIEEQVSGTCSGGSGEKQEGVVSETMPEKPSSKSVFASSVYGGERTDQMEAMSRDFSDNPNAQQFEFGIENNRVGASKMTRKGGDGGKPTDAFGTSDDNAMDLDDEIVDCEVLEGKEVGTGTLKDRSLGLQKSDAAGLVEAIDRISDNTAVEETIEFVNIGSESQRSVNKSHDEDDASMGVEKVAMENDDTPESKSQGGMKDFVSGHLEVLSGEGVKSGGATGSTSKRFVVVGDDSIDNVTGSATKKVVGAGEMEKDVGRIDHMAVKEWEFLGDEKENDDDGMSLEEFSFASSNDSFDEKDSSQQTHGVVETSFNMELLRDSIKKGENVLSEVTGKDVVLVVGKTGVGKSTLIQGIAGKSFHETSFTTAAFSETVETQVFEPSDPIPGFEIGHAKSSKTQALNVFCRKGSTPGGSVVYIDTPGFEDTEGIEVDVATSVMLTQVSKRCQTMRFVVLINYVSLLEDRGGTLRAVLKFVRKFVSDFKKSQQSFVFLFTHTNQIKTMPETVDGAKSELGKEVIKIIDGTKDDEVLDVLHFLRKCLAKGYPFVDVVHPLRTDFSLLASFIEQKVKAMEYPRIAASCGLTSASQMKLSAEVQRLLHETKHLFAHGSVDSARLIEIQSHFRYFAKYIAFGDVLKAVNENKELMDEQIKNLYMTVDEEICNGTNSFDCVPDIDRLKEAIRLLDSLDSNFSIQFTTNKIVKKVTAFRTEFINSLVEGFAGTDIKLVKIKTWCKLSLSLMDGFFEEAVSAISNAVQKCVQDISDFNFSDLENVDQNEFFALFSNLKKLKQLKEESVGGRCVGDLNFDVVPRAFFSAFRQMSQVFEEWSSDCNIRLKNLDFRNEETILLLLKRATALEVIQKELRSNCIRRKTGKEVETLAATICTGVVQKFVAACTRLEETKFQVDGSWGNQVFSLYRSSELFGSLQDSSWKGLHSSFSSLIESLKVLAIKKAGDLEEKAHENNKRGFRDGRHNGEALCAFEALLWLDSFLLPESCFVGNVSIAVRQQYDDRGEKLKGLTDDILKELNQTSNKSKCSALTELLLYVDEIKQLFEFGLIVKSETLGVLGNSLKSSLETYAVSRFENWSGATSEWDQLVEDLQPEKLAKLNSFLGDSLEEIGILLQLVDGLDSDISVSLRTTQGRIRTSLKSFSNQVESIFEAKNFKQMAKAYACCEAIDINQYTSKYLPSCHHLREVARKQVSVHAARIEEAVTTTSEWDHIDSLITEFEKAVVLDDVLGLDVQSRLGPLKRIRDGKEDEVDGVLEEMISNQDYHGIKGFLVPLSKSKDQVRIQKFNTCIMEIASALRQIEQDVRNDVEAEITAVSAKQIAVGLEILDCACKELGTHLRPKYDVQVKLDLIKQRMFKHIEALVGAATRAAEEYDMVSLKKNSDRIKLYSQNFSQHFTPRIKKRIKDSLDTSCNLLESIPSRLDKFFESTFKDEMDLSTILSGMKPALESNDPTLSELRKLYQDYTTRLRSCVDDVVQKYRQIVAKRECYDDSIDILQELESALHRGLDKHLPEERCMEYTSLLESWKDARTEQESFLRFSAQNAEETLIDAALILDKQRETIFSSRSSTPAWKGYVPFLGSEKETKTSKTYKRNQGVLTRVASKWHGEGMNALVTRDHSRIQECIHILTLMESKVGKHLPLAAEKLSDLKSEVRKQFLSFCSNVSILLESEKSHEFERSFADYRGFVVHIPFLPADPDVAKKMQLIHQSLFVCLEKKIDSLFQSMTTFDFRKIKAMAEATRVFGGFVADKFSLLHEEFESHGHLELDEWLEKLMSDIVYKYFRRGRDLGGLKHFATLGCVPSSSFPVVKKSWKTLSLKYHPDKCKDQKKLDQSKEKFRQITESFQELEKRFEQNDDGTTAQPFDQELEALGSVLMTKVRVALTEQNYKNVEELLSNFGEMSVLDNLVEPNIDTSQIRNDITQLIARHVKQTRIEINTRWSERSYKDLNHSITDLKMMEQSFRSYPAVFDRSWNSGIVEEIENEIIALAQKARAYLSSKQHATEHVDEFRRCFMGMGSVLVELPTFKDFTRRAMSDVLEVCLASDWGYSYLFELGLSLRKSENMENDDDVRIAHMILGQFKQFKEVLTMVWNEETIQKPVEDTVKDILVQSLSSKDPASGLESIELSTLKSKFEEFEHEYKSVLGTYLDKNADLNKLVRSITIVSDGLKPVTKARFGKDVKDEIPRLLAGVFGLFTILKSGESYNRMEDSSDVNVDANKLLLKPHNIQVVTLLCLFGCENTSSSMLNLQSQLMQIRTGEGKSMILGAAAVVLGLLGFEVRCVCYSEYLSQRDFELFREVFDHFGLIETTKYSKITSFSEDMAAAKGDIRDLTLSLIRGAQTNSHQRAIASSSLSNNQLATKREQVLLVDEVDVFFSGSFYGQTYNKVAFLQEPEISFILMEIWSASCEGRKKVRLGHIKSMPQFSTLIQKYNGFEFCIENEISRMLDEVRRLDETPYHLDQSTDRIGHKIMDTVSFSVSFGYRTIFAYLKEADQLKDKSGTLTKELGMLISCGQFSFANITPDVILGVSGTLQVMGDYERDVLKRYGVQRFMYVPSVYGSSRFQFDKAADGISIETSVSDFYQKITGVLVDMARSKRAGIVFFSSTERLNDFVSSPFYRKLGRNKSVLREDMTNSEKEFVISKAATVGQVTVCSAVFGRGTDFFCKDETVEKNGGVHVIQAFFSSEESEEIQIQGRTARQGKKGTFSMVLLEKDLDDEFGIPCGSAAHWPRRDRYTHLCDARKRSHTTQCAAMDAGLVEATDKDKATHSYFDALCRDDRATARTMFKEVYLSMKKNKTPSIITLDLAFVIDNTGSMAPYGSAIESTISSMLSGTGCLTSMLSGAFPETSFTIRYAVLGYRDIDDGTNQFLEHTWSNDGCHFTPNSNHTLQVTKQLLSKASGGGDVAEDHLGAIQRCVDWNAPGDWDESSIKAILLLTDSPAHQFVPQTSQASDKYSAKHPAGLTVDAVVDKMVTKNIGLFFGSFDPTATSAFEDDVRSTFVDHKENAGELVMVSIPMGKPNHPQPSGNLVAMASNQRHIVFVLDESGSMQHEWAGVVSAYNNYVASRRQQQFESDLVSVVQFASSARVTVTKASVVNTPTTLGYNGGGTSFGPAASSAYNVARQTPASHQPLIVFMSDGQAGDASTAASHFIQLNQEAMSRYGSELDLHVIAFGGGASSSQLQMIANSSSKGRLHSAASTYDLSNVFVQIAGGRDKVATVLKEEIGKRVLDAVSDRIVAEYSG